MKGGNGKTASNAQIIQKWRLLPADFSEKSGTYIDICVYICICIDVYINMTA